MSLTIAHSAVPADLVVEVASRLFYAGRSKTAVKLVAAQREGLKHVSLSVDDRDAILSVLDDSPAGLEGLRGALLLDHERRRREGS